jgi:hypothetical protein
MPNFCRRHSFGSAKRTSVNPSAFLLFVTVEGGSGRWKGTNRITANERELLTGGLIS